MITRGKRIAAFVLLTGVLAAWLVAADPFRIQEYLAFGTREWYILQTLLHLRGYTPLTGHHFVLYYSKPDRTVAGMVLETADNIFGPVTENMGYRPLGKSLVVLEPNERALQQVFGWKSEAAAGTYFEGIIRLLSPLVWVASRNALELRAYFWQDGPTAHEFTHLVLDYQTAGNYPAWYTEGLAQYEERRINGYEWVSPQSNLLTASLYGLGDLQDDFYGLSNQALAYREALSLVTFLRLRGGPAAIRRLDGLLATGMPFPNALRQVVHVPPSLFYRQWAAFIHAHPLPWE